MFKKYHFFKNKGLANLQIMYTCSGLFYGRATAMEYGVLAFIMSNCEICERGSKLFHLKHESKEYKNHDLIIFVSLIIRTSVRSLMA